MKIIQISYNIYKLYKFNEIISGTPLKILKKKWGHFLKMDILKMSNFQKAIIKFYKKSEKSVSLSDALNTKNIRQKLLPYFFFR